MSTPTSLPSLHAEALAGKYLTFALGRESYGIAVLRVREIIRTPEITPLPRMPDHIRGVLNLRGMIVPVLDLRRRFHIPAEPYAEAAQRSCIVVAQVELPEGRAIYMGLLVDGVEEVVTILNGDLEAPPRLGAPATRGHVVGMAKVKNRVKTLLDIDRVALDENLDGLGVLNS